MMTRPSFARRSVWTLLAVAIGLALFGRLVGSGLGQEKKRVYIKTTGKVVAVAPDSITVSADGKVYQLKVKADQSAIAVTGKLTPDQLKAGAIVRCTGLLKGNTLQDEISELKVYTAADGYQADVLQDAPDQPATITGLLQNLRKNAVTIAIGRRKITGKLADEPTIVVESKDHSLARPGDSIQFKGYLTGNGTTIATPREVVITLGGAASSEEKDAAGESVGKPARNKANE